MHDSGVSSTPHGEMYALLRDNQGQRRPVPVPAPGPSPSLPALRVVSRAGGRLWKEEDHCAWSGGEMRAGCREGKRPRVAVASSPDWPQSAHLLRPRWPCAPRGRRALHPHAAASARDEREGQDRGGTRSRSLPRPNAEDKDDIWAQPRSARTTMVVDVLICLLLHSHPPTLSSLLSPSATSPAQSALHVPSCLL